MKSRQQLPPEIKEVEYKTARPERGCAITANVVENAPKTVVVSHPAARLRTTGSSKEFTTVSLASPRKPCLSCGDMWCAVLGLNPCRR